VDEGEIPVDPSYTVDQALDRIGGPRIATAFQAEEIA